MTTSIEARDFSPDPPNSKENLDTCRTCKHFSPMRCGFGMCYLLPTMFSQKTESSEACEDYEPADHQSTNS